MSPRRGWFVAAALLLAPLVTGCSAAGGSAAPNSPSTAVSATAPPYSPQPLPTGRGGTPPVPLPQVGQVAGADATAVARAAVTVMWTYDTTIDTSPYGASVRAAPFLVPSYAAQIKAAPPVAAPGADWNLWSAHRAYTVVSLTAESDSGAPPDTDTTAYRQLGVTITPTGRDGWRGQPQTQTVFVVLNRSGSSAAWRVGTVSVS